MWQLSLPVCLIVGGYCWEKLQVNHFWELKTYQVEAAILI